MSEWIINAVTGLPVEWRVFLLSMLPITELRVAIPLGIAWGIAPMTNYIYAVAGNILPVLPILLFLDPAIRILSKNATMKRFIDRILSSAERKKERYEKYEIFGLTVFVSIPAPGTGAWTGTLLAYLLRVNRLKAFLAISLGVIVVGLLMTGISMGILSLSGEHIVLAIGAGLAILALGIWHQSKQ